MSDTKLKSFKISESHRAGISNPISSKVILPSHSQSVGFARIEKILESETPNSIEEKLNSLIPHLEVFQTEATSNKEKLAGTKAIAAVERVTDLVDYLFQTKEALQTNCQQ